MPLLSQHDALAEEVDIALPEDGDGWQYRDEDPVGHVPVYGSAVTGLPLLSQHDAVD